MSVHSFHLARISTPRAVRALTRPATAPGPRHLAALAGMPLGAPVVSTGRMQIRRLVVFAERSEEAALDTLLANHWLGRELASGGQVRLAFQRRWGSVGEFAHVPEVAERTDPEEPVVAVTLARMKLPELPRFIHWGRPVERHVRDHPETTWALAAMRPPRSASTFSIWTTARTNLDGAQVLRCQIAQHSQSRLRISVLSQYSVPLSETT